jgi:hypothetical protein
MHRVVVAVVAALVGALVLAAPVWSAPRPSCPKPPDLPPPSDFKTASGDPIPITNPYFPLKPGSSWSYSGKLDGESAKDEVSVSTEPRDPPEILDVRVTVVHDKVFVKNKLVEDTFDWFAQDKEGNVWYFGEDTKELENGEVVSTEGSWEAGVNNARAGIFMPDDPKSKIGQTFKQEDAKNVAEDCSKLADGNASVKVPFGSFNDALRTDEFSLLERDVLDHKFYVENVGLVKEQTVEGGSDFLELVKFNAG